MASPGSPDVFVNLSSAAVRSTRNYHRLEHLGRRGTYTFNEETVTDLLLAEMAGKDYSVEAACPGCVAEEACTDWDGAYRLDRRGVRVRALTKIQEGGNRRYGRLGVHADFVIAVEYQDPDIPGYVPGGPQLRLLVQAKRIKPGETFLPGAVAQNQYNGLIAAADQFGAVPYYALYVQQPDPHRSNPTRCTLHTAAADRAIVLVPAAPATRSGHLPGASSDQVLASGRPLRCLGGCICTGVSTNSTTWAVVSAFVKSDFPEYEATNGETPMPKGLARLVVNAARYKPGVTPKVDLDERNGTTEARDGVLVVRLGQLAKATELDRTVVGYAPGMSADELRDAARMYWRLDPRRAQALRYVVAASRREALQAYEIDADGLTYSLDDSGVRRTAFEMTEVADPAIRAQLLARAEEALERVVRGSRNPVMYLDGLDG